MPALLLAILFAALTLPPAILGRGGTSEQADEQSFHLPAIQTFAAEWPSPDLVRYELAMTPGYHLVMAAVLRAGGSVTTLRIINALIGVTLALAMWWAVRAAMRDDSQRAGWLAPLLALPLLACSYTLGSAISLTTDNAAMLGAVIVLGFAASRPMTLALTLALAGAVLAIVLLRQVHLWLGGVVLFAALSASPIAHHLPAWCRGLIDESSSTNIHNTKPRAAWSPVLGGIIALVIPAIAVGIFAWMWGGLVPVSEWSQKFHGKGPNLAAPAFCLALLGALGPAFAMFHVENVPRLCVQRVTYALAACGGLLVALAVPTGAQLATADGPPPDGRGYGWLWKLAYEFGQRATADVAERSVVITLLAPVGAVVLVFLWRAAALNGRARPATILLVALAGWLAAQTMNPQAWQRYFEPMVLVFLAMLTACGSGLGAWGLREDTARWRAGAWAVLGVVLLALAEFGLSGITLFKEILGQ